VCGKVEEVEVFLGGEFDVVLVWGWFGKDIIRDREREGGREGKEMVCVCTYCTCYRL
jgi:hypothetical protein